MRYDSINSSIRIKRLTTRIQEKSIESPLLSPEQTSQQSSTLLPRPKPVPLTSEIQQSSFSAFAQNSTFPPHLIPVSVPFSVPTPLPAIPKQITLPSSALLPRPKPVPFTSQTISEPPEVSSPVLIPTTMKQTPSTSTFSNIPAPYRSQAIDQVNSSTVIDDIEPVASPWPWPPTIRSTPLKIVYYPTGTKFNQNSYSKLPELSKSGSISDDIESTSPILFSSPDPDFLKN